MKKYLKYIYATLLFVSLVLPKIAFALIIHTGIATKNLVAPSKNNVKHSAEPAACDAVCRSNVSDS